MVKIRPEYLIREYVNELIRLEKIAGVSQKRGLESFNNLPPEMIWTALTVVLYQMFLFVSSEKPRLVYQ